MFYKDVDGNDTFLIAEGESEGDAAAKIQSKNIKSYREIYGEDKLPLSNITRMDKIVDK